MTGVTTLDDWIDHPAPRADPYWDTVRSVAAALKSDGCTGVSDICIDSCYEHDIHWRTGKTVWGADITTTQANRRFRKVIESRFAEHTNPVLRVAATPLGYLFGWGRWFGVTIGAHFISHVSR